MRCDTIKSALSSLYKCLIVINVLLLCFVENTDQSNYRFEICKRSISYLENLGLWTFVLMTSLLDIFRDVEADIDWLEIATLNRKHRENGSELLPDKPGFHEYMRELSEVLERSDKEFYYYLKAKTFRVMQMPAHERHMKRAVNLYKEYERFQNRRKTTPGKKRYQWRKKSSDEELERERQEELEALNKSEIEIPYLYGPEWTSPTTMYTLPHTVYINEEGHRIAHGFINTSSKELSFQAVLESSSKSQLAKVEYEHKIPMSAPSVLEQEPMSIVPSGIIESHTPTLQQTGIDACLHDTSSEEEIREMVQKRVQEIRDQEWQKHQQYEKRKLEKKKRLEERYYKYVFFNRTTSITRKYTKKRKNVTSNTPGRRK